MIEIQCAVWKEFYVKSILESKRVIFENSSIVPTYLTVWKNTIKHDHARKNREINSLVKTVKTLI